MPVGVDSNKNLSKKTILGYEVTVFQDALLNYLIPSICACVLYIFILACDIGVIFRHHQDEDPIWASLTLGCMYFPVVGSFIIIVSDIDLWPEDGFAIANLKWFFLRVIQHLFFPFWQLWRFAERIFWSIEAVLSKDEESMLDAMDHVYKPRVIELYSFLQAYLHALPQVMLQFYILMRHEKDINKITEYIQIISIVLNLMKMAMTTSYFQSFKSQKLAGRQYPWFKSYRKVFDMDKFVHTVVDNTDVVLRKSVIENKNDRNSIEEKYNIEPSARLSRRRSSDIYLEPVDNDDHEKPFLETDFDDTIQTKEIKTNLPRETSVLDGPSRNVFRETNISENSKPNFDIKRVVHEKGLPEDDIVGKFVAFLWWFAFLLARTLAISTFAYFFMKETIYIIISHIVIVIAFLAYDVKSDSINRGKEIFFVFIGLIYIFCIIEFKIRFKKANFIYYGYFILVFTENFSMCAIWYFNKIDVLENDYWFRYIFYFVLMCSMTSFFSMMFYIIINKPHKIIINSKILS